MIEFRTLGTLDLRDAGDGRALQSVLAQPKVTAVLAYLALARPRGFHHRDTLLGIFWPEVSQERARHSLNQALYVLRRAFGEGVLVTRGPDEVGLDFDRFRCDAVEFDVKLGVGDSTGALELYGGDLLSGFYLSGCSDFERWLEPERSTLRERAVRAALALADEREAAGNAVEAIHWTRQAAAWVPYDESVTHRLIGLLRGERDRAGAIREFEAFARRLTADLELEPSADLVALVEAIKTDVGPGAAAATTPSASEGASSASAAESHGGRLADSAVAPSHRSVRVGSMASWVLATVALAAIAVVISSLRSGPADSSPVLVGLDLEPNRVLVLPFINETGDPGLDPIGRIAADWITQGLLRTGRLQIVSGTGTLGHLETWDRGGQPDASAARGLALESGAAHAITGSYVRHDRTLQFQVQIHEVSAGEVAAGFEERDADPSEPMAAIERLRQRATGVLATLLDPHLESWALAASQPPSFEAYRLYAEGMEYFMEYEFPQALTRFYEAVALDSTFTVPLIWALFAQINTGQLERADSLIRAIEPRRPELAPFDQAMLDHQAARVRTFQTPGGISRMGQYETMKKVVELAPNSEWQAWLAVQALMINRPREALELLSRVDPNRGWIRDWNRYWIWLADARHRLGDHERELEDLQRGQQSVWAREHPELADRWFGQLEMWALIGLGRIPEAEARLDRVLAPAADPSGGLPAGAKLSLLSRVGSELRRHGHAEAAGAVVTRALALFDALTLEEQGQTFIRRQVAHVLSAAERWEEATAIYEEILPEQRGWTAQVVHGRLGMAAAIRGDREAAMRHYARVGDHTPESGTPGGEQYVRASIMAYLGERDRAVDLVAESIAHGFGGWNWLYTRSTLKPLDGYEPFEELVRPKG